MSKGLRIGVMAGAIAVTGVICIFVFRGGREISHASAATPEPAVAAPAPASAADPTPSPTPPAAAEAAKTPEHPEAHPDEGRHLDRSQTVPGDIQPLDPKIPLEMTLERRPELLRVLKVDRDQLAARLDEQKAAGKLDDAHRTEMRILRLDQRMAELERRQVAREPAR